MSNFSFQTSNQLSLNPSPLASVTRRGGGRRGKDPALTLTLRQGDTRPNLILTLGRQGGMVDIRDSIDTKPILHVMEPKTREVILEMQAFFVNLYLGSVVFPEWPANWTGSLTPGAYPAIVYLNEPGSEPGLDSQESSENEVWIDIQRAGVTRVATPVKVLPCGDPGEFAKNDCLGPPSTTLRHGRRW